MFRYGSRYDIVRATTEQSRAFAALGLLRQVTEATPVDLICTYIEQTRQPWGIMDLARCLRWDKEDGDPDWNRLVTVRDSKRADRLHIFPDGIVKMTKDYLIRTFWEQIDHLRSNACIRVDPTGYCHYGDGSAVVRQFPKSVLDALAACHVHHSSRLWDAQHAIGALHAVCTPLMLDPPSWIKHNSCNFWMVDHNQFGTFKPVHSRAISALMVMLDNYCWNNLNRGHIPNQAEKNILLDLIECFLVMFGPQSFESNFRVRQIYEYSRIGSVLSNNRPSGGDCCCSGGIRTTGEGTFMEYKRQFRGNWDTGRDAILLKLQHLTPEAAICLGDITSCHRMWNLSPLVMREINPNAIKEVEAYLFTELAVQTQKAREVERVTRALKNGDLAREDGCCGDECVPAEPCGY